MNTNMHRYRIMIHRKGTSFEDDFWFTDNKRFQIREFSHEAAEMAMRIRIISGVIITRSE